MRIKSYFAVILVLILVTACRQSSPAGGERDQEKPKTQQEDRSGPPDASQGQSTTPTGSVGDLAAAFGLSAGRPVPAGLVPGGDCSAAGAGAAQEIAEQAAAPVPLKAGLTMAYAWMRTPQEEYECLIQVKSVDADGVNTTLSCNYPGREGPFHRRVCRSDLRKAQMLHTVYGSVKVIDESGKEVPETIVGATAFSLSSAEFAELKRTGSMTHHYVELGPNGQLAKDGVGELRLEGRATMQVVVNDQPIDVPVITARGQVKWWIRGQRLDTSDVAVILDNEQFPLLIDQQSSAESAASRIQFVKISYPPDGERSPLEGKLLGDRRVDVYGIYFDFNSDRIRAESEPVLKEIGDILKRQPDWSLSIEGHTDNIGGNSASNLELSRRRSDAVRNALVSRFGIAADRLSTAGHGAASPKDTNDTAEGRARNRRVELVRR